MTDPDSLLPSHLSPAGSSSVLAAPE
jgi:hypothetical protein